MVAEFIKLSGVRGITKKLKKLENTPFSRFMLGEIGMFAMMRIKKRTLKGDDVNGIAFKPYSKMYTDDRKDAGFPVKPVDLFRTGSMQSSMTYDVDTNVVEIFFMNTSDPSGAKNPEKAFWLNEDREFFALSASDWRGITKIVNKFYNKVLRS